VIKGSVLMKCIVQLSSGMWCKHSHACDAAAAAAAAATRAQLLLRCPGAATSACSLMQDYNAGSFLESLTFEQFLVLIRQLATY
jgi:hypothetical protein